MKIIHYTLKYHYLLIMRNPLRYCMPLLFFLLVSFLFPLAISPNKHLLQLMGAGIIWIAVLLAHLLALPYLFAEDYADGTLDQLLIQPKSLSAVMSIKIFKHWLLFIFPMILCVPMLAIMFDLSFSAINLLIISLLLGTPVIVMQGAIVGALSVGLARPGLLLAIILLPLYIPLLIFGSVTPIQWELLASEFILFMTFGPSVIAFALRVGITYG